MPINGRMGAYHSNCAIIRLIGKLSLRYYGKDMTKEELKDYIREQHEKDLESLLDFIERNWPEENCIHEENCIMCIAERTSNLR